MGQERTIFIYEPEDTTQKPITLFHAINQSLLSSHEKTTAQLQQERVTIYSRRRTIAQVISHTRLQLLEDPGILRKVKDDVLETETLTAYLICRR